MRGKLIRLRKDAAHRGYTLTELFIAIVAALVALIAIAGLVLFIMYLVGFLPRYSRAVFSGQPTIQHIVLGGDIDVFEDDEDEYRGEYLPTEKPESRQQSPYDYARRCGRKNCRIASVGQSADKSTTGYVPDFAKLTLNG